MNASQLFVKRWTAKYCPTFNNIMNNQAKFVHMVVDAAAGPVNMIFMKSTHSTWESLPEYGAIVAAATAEGRNFFSEMLSAKSYSAYISSGGWLFGPAAIQAAIRGNDVSGTTAYQRVVTALGGSTSMGDDTQLMYNARSGALKSMSDFQSLSVVQKALKALHAAGHVDIQGPFTCENALIPVGAVSLYTRTAKIATEMMNKCGPSRFSLNFMIEDATQQYGFGDTNQVINLPYYYTVGALDQSIYEFTCGYTYGLVAPGSNASPMFGVSISSELTGDILNAYNAVNTLNPAYSPANVKGVFGLQRVDDYWLPLCVLPGKHEYLVRCGYESATFSSSIREEGIETMTATVSKPDTVAVMPVQWYIDYAKKAVAKKASNSAQLAKAATDMEEYVSKSITAITYAAPVMLAADLIESTQLYQDYKKAREKACEENDFMGQQFTEKMKYGELNTLINGSRSTRTFYGFRDTNEISALAGAIPASTKGWILTGGGANVTVRRADGTFGPSFTKEQGSDMLQCIATGAVFVGVTLEQQFTIWGLDIGLINQQNSGLNEQTTRAMSALSQGSPTAYYDFRWQSVGVTGIPDVRAMAPDAAARAVMTSKGAIQPLGNHMLSILNDEIMGFYKETLLGLPA